MSMNLSKSVKIQKTELDEGTVVILFFSVAKKPKVKFKCKPFPLLLALDVKTIDIFQSNYSQIDSPL